MKNRLVAGLLAAGFFAAIFTIPAEARCENISCTSLATKHIKKLPRIKTASANKTRSTRVKIRLAVASKAKTAGAKSRVAAEVKPVRAKIAHPKIVKVTKVHTALVSRDQIVSAVDRADERRVWYTFNAPLRKRPAVALPASTVAAPAKQSGGSVVAMIKSMAPQYGVPTWFALRIAKVESGYNPNARGLAGELGVFQMKCATARGIGYRGNCAGLLHARTGVKYGLKHLSTALKLSRGNLKLAASKHNGGLGRKSLVAKYVAAVF